MADIERIRTRVVLREDRVENVCSAILCRKFPLA
jgi:hypothetical protein